MDRPDQLIFQIGINRDLMTTYVRTEAQLKELWRCESELQAKNL